MPDDSEFLRENRLRQEYFEVPLLLVQRIERPTDKAYSTFEVYTKDGRFIRLSFQQEVEQECKLIFMLSSLVFPQAVHSRFAFRHCFEGPGWELYSVETDMARLGVTPGPQWTFLDNSAYTYCETYPKYLVVPTAMSLDELKISANFRSKSRLPAMVWTSGTATLWRSSQPKTGVRTTRCEEDEKYLRLIAFTSKDSPALNIYDARPFINAHAQRVLGGGVENPAYYEHSTIQFLKIANIHTIRDAWQGMWSANFVTPSKYLSAVEKSGWLELLSLILDGAVSVANSLRTGVSVLIHCTDGWDRTAQFSSLAQLFLDPHYRSISGFATLVEKEWVSFGHQFDTRLGHGNSQQNDDKRSPIFIQFLDCVHQLLVQFPSYFQFNRRFLYDLAYFSYSCRFGTFMCNNMRQRDACQLMTKTSSVWSFMLAHAEEYQNPYYRGDHLAMLVPCTSIRRLEIWHDFFSRWNQDYYYSVSLFANPSQHKEVLARTTLDGIGVYEAMLKDKQQEQTELAQQVKAQVDA